MVLTELSMVSLAVTTLPLEQSLSLGFPRQSRGPLVEVTNLNGFKALARFGVSGHQSMP